MRVLERGFVSSVLNMDVDSPMRMLSQTLWGSTPCIFRVRASSGLPQRRRMVPISRRTTPTTNKPRPISISKP